MKKELARLKEDKPDMTHKERYVHISSNALSAYNPKGKLTRSSLRFTLATQNWKTAKEEK